MDKGSGTVFSRIRVTQKDKVRPDPDPVLDPQHGFRCLVSFLYLIIGLFDVFKGSWGKGTLNI